MTTRPRAPSRRMLLCSFFLKAAGAPSPRPAPWKTTPPCLPRRRPWRSCDCTRETHLCPPGALGVALLGSSHWTPTGAGQLRVHASTELWRVGVLLAPPSPTPTSLRSPPLLPGARALFVSLGSLHPAFPPARLSPLHLSSLLPACSEPRLFIFIPDTAFFQLHNFHLVPFFFLPASPSLRRLPAFSIVRLFSFMSSSRVGLSADSNPSRSSGVRLLAASSLSRGTLMPPLLQSVLCVG